MACIEQDLGVRRLAN
ncbi:hypothetical protein VTL71DRAFT_2043 [Oculimacula yallundae]|uniref:Uncharacterized protein n=1 Tax=Oculimacula yallundae TaxID=86028 RepID=A0ABR4C8X1_9HELO